MKMGIPVEKRKTNSCGTHLKCNYDEKISSRFSSHFESICIRCSIGRIFCSNYKRKTILTPLFKFNGLPLLGAVSTDKLSVIWIEEKVTSLIFTHKLKNAVCEWGLISMENTNLTI